MMDESLPLNRPTQSDAAVVTPLIEEFWRWKETDGAIGREPAALLSLSLTPKQRALFHQAMQDVLTLCDLSESLG